MAELVNGRCNSRHCGFVFVLRDREGDKVELSISRVQRQMLDVRWMGNCAEREERVLEQLKMRIGLFEEEEEKEEEDVRL